MVTYSQPIISQAGKFLGIATIDISVDALCYGQQCDFPVDYNYLTNVRPAGFTFVAISMASSIGCGLWTYKSRKDKVVIASQPVFMAMICVGCFILASAIIPLSIDDSIASPEGCSKACMAFPWVRYLLLVRLGEFNRLTFQHLSGNTAFIYWVHYHIRSPELKNLET